MRLYTYQRMGCMQGKKEMEDRAVAGKNVLAAGFHSQDNLPDGVYGIMDGVGGLKGSAFASTCVARALADTTMPLDESCLKETLQQVHTDLVNYSSTATTATGLAISQGQYLLFHIGNTRLFGLFDGYIRPLTSDQTKYESMLRSGSLPSEIPESAKCELNACLGVDQSLIDRMVIRDISKEISQCSKMLLTSDGIHDHLSLDDLEETLAKEITEESLRGLADLAVERGSEDDLSIMVIEK